MIYYLVTQRNCYTLYPFLTYWARDFNQHLRILTYSSLSVRSPLEPGTYIFSDIERLTPAEIEMGVRLCASLQEAAGFQAVNHPAQSMRRYQLLRTLYERNINNFNIYRLTEIPPGIRFPVFIRWEDEHSILTPLLRDQKELKNALADFKDDLKGKVVVEFCDTSDHTGLFRKYSAYYVNGRVLPIHIMYSEQWCVKSGVLDNAEAQEEEREYIENSPHEEQIEDIFEIAQIDYGRIDYGLLDGRLQIWEINTNPHLLPLRRVKERRGFRDHFLMRFKAALSDLDMGCQEATSGLLMDSAVEQEAKGLVLWQAANEQIKTWYYFTRASPYRLTRELRRIVRRVYGLK